MDINQVFDIIKDVTPGVWKIGITYRKELPILKRGGAAEAAGIAQGDVVKEVFRWCSARVNPANTKSAELARQAKADAIANGEEVKERRSGFHATSEADEENLIQYRDGTDEACLILKKGPHPDKVKYYLWGAEISHEKLEELIANKIVSKTALNELAPNEIFYMYPDKIASIKMGGQLYEGMNNKQNISEAVTFNGKIFPNEDGFYNVEEELAEDCDIEETIEKPKKGPEFANLNKEANPQGLPPERSKRKTSHEINESVNDTISSDKGFYVGDICYALADDIYHGVWGEHNYEDGTYEANGWRFAVASTAYGDGEYDSTNGKYTFGVDAGNIGIVPLELATKYDFAELRDLGAIFETPGTAKFNAEDGEFTIELPNEFIQIDTAYNYEDNEWNWADDEEDYEEDDYDDEYTGM